MSCKKAKRYKNCWIQTFSENGYIAAYIELPNEKGVVPVGGKKTPRAAIAAAKTWIDQNENLFRNWREP